MLSRWAFLVVLWTLIVLIFHFPLIALAVFAVLAVAFYRTSGLYYRRHHQVSR